MFLHYLKASLNTFKRFSIQLSLAMFSLIIGLTGAVILLLYAYQEFSHDDKIPNVENIYRIDNDRMREGGVQLHEDIFPRPLPPLFKGAFEEVDLISRAFINSSRKEQLINGIDKILRSSIRTDRNFFKIFNFPAVLGDINHFNERPDALVLTETTAKTIFGETHPIGRILFASDDASRPLMVTAVIKDLPDNIHFSGDFFYREDERNIGKNNDPFSAREWRSASSTYFTIKEGINPSQITAKLPQFVEQYVPEKFRVDTQMKLHIVSVKDIYFHGPETGRLKSFGNIELVYGFMTIAGILIIISSFNFTNLMLAVHSARRKELALRKVAGAYQSQLVVHITTEISFLILTGILVSIGFANLLLPFFNQVFFVSLSQNLFENPLIAFGYISILVVVVILSSMSPSRMVGSIRPASVLSGSELQHQSSKLFRNVFLTIQFSIAIAIIPIVLVVLAQINYAEQKDMGFKKEGIIAMRGLNNVEMRNNHEALKKEIKSLPFVKFLTSSYNIPGDDFLEQKVEVIRQGKTQSFNPINIVWDFVGYDYFKTYEIDLLAGRTFSKNFIQDNAYPKRGKPFNKSANILINEAGLKAFGFKTPDEAIGQTLIIDVGIKVSTTIIGVIPDINAISLKKSIPPILYINLEAFHDNISIAFETNDTQAMIENLRGVWKKLGATVSLDYVFVQDNWNKAYADDRMAANIFTVFAMIGVLISLAGIYSVMLFETSKQLREVAIRKVMGGSVQDIMKLLMLKSSIPVVIACFIALPLAWYGLSQWLNGYVDRIALDPLVFIGSGLAMLLISWITVGSHAYKVASTKPAEALRGQ